MNTHITFDITVNTLVKIVTVGAFAALLWMLRDLVLILLTAIVIASAFEPVTQMFMRLQIPRILAILLVYGLFIGTFVGIMYSFIPPLLTEASGILEDMPGVANALQETAVVSNFFPEGVQVTDLTGEVNTLVSQYSNDAFALFNGIFGSIFVFALIILFSFYFAVQENGVEEFVRVVVPRRYEAYVLDLWARSRKKIGLWMQGQLLLGIIIGVLTYLGLTIIGVKYALVLALMAGLFELIPVFGPILAALPALGIAFTTGGVTLMLVVAAFYVILQQFENNLLYPLVVRKVVGVPALMVILALIVGAQLAGFLGVLLSVPLAAVLQEILADLDKWKHEEKPA